MGCAGGLATYRTKVENNSLTIPKHEAEQLKLPNGILIIHAADLPGSIVLRNVEGKGLIALSTVCTHRGCEVRPFPDSLRCPCHGSEYDQFGEVLEGPARQPLKKFVVRETTESIVIAIA